MESLLGYYCLDEVIVKVHAWVALNSIEHYSVHDALRLPPTWQFFLILKDCHPFTHFLRKGVMNTILQFFEFILSLPSSPWIEFVDERCHRCGGINRCSQISEKW